MTLPSVVRVFFAVELPLPVKDEIGRSIMAIKKKAKGAHAIRWTKPENLHITLQFLGEAKRTDLPQLIEEVRANIAGKFKKFFLNLGNLYLFPSPYRPRVIVLDVAPQEELAQLSKRIGEGITALGYEIESRPFRGHLTIGRIKQPQGLNLSFLSEFKIPAIEDLELKEVVLFRSEPQPEGSMYTIVEKIGFSV